MEKETTPRDKARSILASVLLLEEKARLLRRAGRPDPKAERDAAKAKEELLVLLLDLEPEVGEHPLEIYVAPGEGPQSRLDAFWWLLEAARGSPGVSLFFEFHEGSWRVCAFVLEPLDLAIVSARRVPISGSELPVH